MTLVEAPVQAFAQPHTEQQERGVGEHLGQRRQQAAVEQKGEGEQAVEGEPDSNQGGAQSRLVQLGAGQAVDQQRAARGEQAVAEAGGQGNDASQPGRALRQCARPAQAPQFAAGEPDDRAPKPTFNAWVSR